METEYHIERIIVERPKPGEEPFFGITLQKVIYDNGEIASIKSRHDVLYVKESDLASDEVDVHDNITHADVHLSGDAMYHCLLQVCKDMVSAKLNYRLVDGKIVDA